MSMDKIAKIVLVEVVEAFIFIVLIMLFDSTQMLSNQTYVIYLIWGLMGVGTPFIIWLELEEELARLINNK